MKWFNWSNSSQERILDLENKFCRSSIIKVLVAEKTSALEEYKKKVKFVEGFATNKALNEFIENKVCINCKIRLECAILPGHYNYISK